MFISILYVNIANLKSVPIEIFAEILNVFMIVRNIRQNSDVFYIVKQSNQEECSRRLLCCRPRLIRCAIEVIAVGPCMVVSDIGEFLHGLVQFLLCAKLI